MALEEHGPPLHVASEDCTRQQVTEPSAPVPRWIDASANGFGVALVDCRPVALTYGSWSKDQNVAKCYLDLRSDSGARVRDTAPVNAARSAPHLSYPFTDARPEDGPVFRSSRMEEKWDVTWLSPFIYFTRSWTGDVVFRVEVEFGDHQMVVRELLAANPSSGKKPDEQQAACDADFLIKTLMYRWEGPHFLPCSPSDDPMTIAMASFAKFGRHGLFATYVDTTRFTLRRK